MIYRVYLNSLEEERCWSVDEGDISSEKKFLGVVIAAKAITRQDMEKRGSKTEPCCWLEVRGKFSSSKLQSGWAIIY